MEIPELLIRARREAQNWRDTAEQAQNDREYYKSLVVQIGELFGEEARRSDDGTLQDSVLCAKVPELVKALQFTHTKSEVFNLLSSGSYIAMVTPTGGEFLGFPQLPMSVLQREIIVTDPAFHALSALGVPPPELRKRGQGYRLGWKEMGLPGGPGISFYVMTQ